MNSHPCVDLVVLSRDDAPLCREVQQGIAAQDGIRLTTHRLFGRPRPTDFDRFQTIARARNRGKHFGTASWLMFLDDDVVLFPSTVRRLVGGLKEHAAYGALAADYLGDSVAGGVSLHVGMGATLFRRSALARIRFRWGRFGCECIRCCYDMRRLGLGIAYLPSLHAIHLRNQPPGKPDPQTARDHALLRSWLSKAACDPFFSAKCGLLKVSASARGRPACDRLLPERPKDLNTSSI